MTERKRTAIVAVVAVLSIVLASLGSFAAVMTKSGDQVMATIWAQNSSTASPQESVQPQESKAQTLQPTPETSGAAPSSSASQKPSTQTSAEKSTETERVLDAEVKTVGTAAAGNPEQLTVTAAPASASSTPAPKVSKTVGTMSTKATVECVYDGGNYWKATVRLNNAPSGTTWFVQVQVGDNAESLYYPSNNNQVTVSVPGDGTEKICKIVNMKQL